MPYAEANGQRLHYESHGLGYPHRQSRDGLLRSVVQGSAHGVNIERPDELARLVLEFLRAVDSGRLEAADALRTRS